MALSTGKARTPFVNQLDRFHNLGLRRTTLRMLSDRRCELAVFFNQSAGMPLLAISLCKQLSISISLKGFRSTGIFA